MKRVVCVFLVVLLVFPTLSAFAANKFMCNCNGNLLAQQDLTVLDWLGTEGDKGFFTAFAFADVVNYLAITNKSEEIDAISAIVNQSIYNLSIEMGPGDNTVYVMFYGDNECALIAYSIDTNNLLYVRSTYDERKALEYSVSVSISAFKQALNAILATK